MSRQNKVNPGMYTQRGRLTQDDAARELRKQSAFASPHTWQPVNRRLRPAPAGDAARGAEGAADAETERETRPAAKATASQSKTTKAKTAGARRATRATEVKGRAAKTKTGKAKTGKAKTGKAKTGKAKTGKAKTGKAKTRAVKRPATARRGR